MKRNELLDIMRLKACCIYLEDPGRQSGNYQQELTDIFVIALTGIICGCERWDEIEDYAQTKQEWLKTYLSLANGILSESTL